LLFLLKLNKPLSLEIVKEFLLKIKRIGYYPYYEISGFKLRWEQKHANE